MRLGSTVTGRMKLGQSPGIEIPAAAVIRSERQSAVWVVDPKPATVSARQIEVASSTPSSACMVASGLKPGDIVVTAGVQALRPGQKVRAARGRAVIGPNLSEWALGRRSFISS